MYTHSPFVVFVSSMKKNQCEMFSKTQNFVPQFNWIDASQNRFTGSKNWWLCRREELRSFHCSLHRKCVIESHSLIPENTHLLLYMRDGSSEHFCLNMKLLKLFLSKQRNEPDSFEYKNEINLGFSAPLKHFECDCCQFYISHLLLEWK